jgi:hypothetical protein
LDRDAPQVVNLEITVPIFPANLHRHEPAQAPATGQYSESNESEDVQQVQLVPLGLQQDPSLHQRREHQSTPADASVRMIHSILFRIFHLTLPAPGQPFLLQVLRTHNAYIGKKRRKRTQTKAHTGTFYVTDAMAFSVEFRPSGETAETTVTASTPTSTPGILPGMNRVIIYLDNEGTPTGYSIDGAES